MIADEIKARVVVYILEVLRGQPWPTTIAGFCRTADCHNWSLASDVLKSMVDSDLVVIYKWIANRYGVTPVRVPSTEIDGAVFHGEFGVVVTPRAVELYRGLQAGQ